MSGSAFNLGPGTHRIEVLLENGTFRFESMSFAVSAPSLTSPTLLSATPGAAGSIGLTWAPVPGASGYKVHWQTALGVDAAGSPVSLTGPNTHDYIIAGLIAGTTYYYAIQATRGSGHGAFSNTLAVATEAAGTAVPIDYWPASTPLDCPRRRPLTPPPIWS